jgi:hypothetical protein
MPVHSELLHPAPVEKQIRIRVRIRELLVWYSRKKSSGAYSDAEIVGKLLKPDTIERQIRIRIRNHK